MISTNKHTQYFKENITKTRSKSKKVCAHNFLENLSL